MTTRHSDTEWFDALYLEYSSEIFWIAMAYTDDCALAEDAVQEAFIYLWEHPHTYSRGQNFRAYMARIVRSYLIDDYRRQQRLQIHSDGIVHETKCQHEADADAPTPEEISYARQLLARLPNGCREIFLRCVIDGESYATVAEERGVSINTVKTQIKVAYRKLRKSGILLILLPCL